MVEVTPTQYLKDGVAYDRITSIIHMVLPNPSLRDWRETMGKARANREMKRTARIGTRVDQIISQQLQTVPAHPTKLSVEERQCLRGFKEWYTLNPIPPAPVAHVQVTLFDEELKIGTTPDYVHDEVIDWKTTSRISLAHKIQVTVGMKLTKLGKARIVRFDRILGTWEECVLLYQAEYWELFVNLLKVYRGWQALGIPAEVA